MPDTAVIERDVVIETGPSETENGKTWNVLELPRDQQVAEGLLLTPKELKEEGKRLYKEFGKITDQDRRIHRRMTNMLTSLSRRKTPNAEQNLLWTQTKDVDYPHFAAEVSEAGGDIVISEEPSAGDIVIEGYGDTTKNQVASYVVQLNRSKGNRDRPYKIKLEPSGISLLTRNEETGAFETAPDFPSRLLRELQETVAQLQGKELPRRHSSYKNIERYVKKVFNK